MLIFKNNQIFAWFLTLKAKFWHFLTNCQPLYSQRVVSLSKCWFWPNILLFRTQPACYTKSNYLLRNMYLSLEYVCPLYKCAIDLLHMWLKVMTVITRNQGVNGRTVSRKRSSTEPDRGDWLGYGTSFITKCWHLVSDKPPFIHE